jgi:hypothetical protein
VFNESADQFVMYQSVRERISPHDALVARKIAEPSASLRDDDRGRGDVPGSGKSLAGKRDIAAGNLRCRVAVRRHRSNPALVSWEQAGGVRREKRTRRSQ